MHSSRMRTARLLPVSPSMHCSWGGVPGPRGVPSSGGCTCLGGYLVSRGMYLVPWGCTWSWGCTCPGVHLVPGGCTCPGDAPGPGGCTCPWGVPGPGRGTCPGTPSVNRMTNRCKNINLPQTSFAGGN